MSTLRNFLVIAVIALAVFALPGGGRAADLFGAVISIAFAGAVAFFAGRTYRERRVEIYGLGDRDRAILYGSLGLGVIMLAATSRLTANGLGTLVWVALLALIAWGLTSVYRAYRRY